MIIEVKGNIFDILDQYNLDAMVNPVNCVGVPCRDDSLGKGLALEFKNKYHNYYNSYYNCCNSKHLHLKNLHIYPQNNFYIFSFPTKYHWKDKSDLNQISNLLNNHFIGFIDKLKLNKIGLPYLGCGLGEIDKEEFKTELYKIHDSNEAFQNIEIYLVEYDKNK